MAEVGHSRNATRGAKNDSLARVAEDHIVESALLKAKIERYIMCRIILNIRTTTFQCILKIE